jgi:NAD(P)-dependent dehydrogenase (short-subunit alcohol dehydrogenase family)
MAISEDLTGRRALVTGGTRGTVARVVERLREAGASVLTTARTQPQGAADLDFVVADVATVEGTERVIAAAGQVDILVHVVGRSHSPSGGFAALDDRA